MCWTNDVVVMKGQVWVSPEYRGGRRRRDGRTTGTGGVVSEDVRQIVAMQHWLGKPEYTLGDAIESLIKTS